MALSHKLKTGSKWFLRTILPGDGARRTFARRVIALRCLQHLRNEVTFHRNGFVWTGPIHCEITRSIFMEGHYQDGYIQQITPWIDANRPVIVNVGANIGDVALPLSRTCKRVLAVEPNPRTFAQLQKNVCQNSLEERVTCCQFAISSRVGTAELVIASEPGSSELLGEAGAVGFDGVRQRRDVLQVKTIPLDELVRACHVAFDEIALVWSDTQGFESQVIDSGSGLWSHGVPLWVEVWPKGLECHGGTGQFLKLCSRYFSEVVIGTDRLPVASLESLVAGLKPGDFTDVLLLPLRASS